MIEAAELVRLRESATEHKRRIKFHRRRLRWTHDRISELESRLKQAGIKLITTHGEAPKEAHGRSN